MSMSLAACGQTLDEPSPPSPSESQSEHELNGMEGMFEFAIDIPWRMEPHIQPDGLRRYDAVPITIAIHDEDTNTYSDGGRIWNFCKIEVSRYRSGQAIGTQTFLPSQLAWMEYTGKPPGAPATQATYWPTPAQGLSAPTTSACYPSWQNCSGFDKIYNTSEWHALLKWDPGTVLPGFEDTLQLVAYVSADEDCFSRQIKLVNYARAHWAYDPLPRFGDDRWLYGDLHYHSQSTDNEGESGYSYRAVTNALGAIGVDFTFATDHASDSEQMVDADRLDWDDLFPERFRGLRDLNQQRWDAAQFKLHGLVGANADVADLWPQDRRRVPRLFLGAEVDVTPEVGVAPTTYTPGSGYWIAQYGNGRIFDIAKWAAQHSLSDLTLSAASIPYVFQAFTDRNGLPAYKLADSQGSGGGLRVGRQHLVHLPRFADTPSGFVGSRTSTYGGATRHAIETNASGGGILPEIAAKEGVAFLAHPINGGGGGAGPGMAPYSDYQYGKIFEQPSFAGLQLWNEDARMSSAGCFGISFPATACPNIGEYEVTGYEWLGVTSGGSHAPGWDDGEYKYKPMWNVSSWSWQRIRFGVDQALHNGAFVWDRLLRWGLDQGRTEQISWLAPGEPRRLFMAGGSDAHGDWNYRREGYMTETSEANDTAIAKVRNLVFAGRGRTGCRPTDWLCFDPVPPASQNTHDQATVADALAEGKFSVTDGPAVRLVVDRNRNGIIDDTDYPMGSVVDLYGDEGLPIIVEWHSTSEFGLVDRVDLYVGVDADPQCVGECLSPVNESRARTYAPPDHGARRDPDETYDRTRYVNVGYSAADPPANECAGRCRMQDGYWLPVEGAPRQKLRHIPLAANGYRGTYPVTLNLDDYPSSGTIVPRATRAYVRAFVRTKRTCDLKSPLTPVDVAYSGKCVPRYGFTNPVWALRKTWLPGLACPTSERSLDRDRDSSPDICDAAPDDAAFQSWSRTFGGAGWDSADGMTFDGAGNLYVVARTTGAGRIDRGRGVTTPFSGPDIDAHLLKYDPSGALAGRFHIMGQGAAYITDVATDFIGNLYITGYFSGHAQIGDASFVSTDGDAFAAKLRAADLSVIWARQLGGAGYGRAQSLSLTPDGNVVVLGTFSGVLQTYAGTLTADGTLSDCFLVWLNATTGSQRAMQRVGGTGDCTAADVVSDGQSRAYAAVTYTGAVQLGFASKTTVGRDSMIARFGNVTEMGTPSWVAWVGDSTTGSDAMIEDLARLPNDDLAITGRFTGTLRVARDTQAFSTVGSSAGGYDGLFLKIARADGATLVPPAWRFGSTGNDLLSAIASDSSGRVLLTGWYDSPTLPTAAGTLTRTGSADGLVLLLDAAHQVQWATDFGTTSSNVGSAAAFSADNRMAYGGYVAVPAAIGNFDGSFTVRRTP